MSPYTRWLARRDVLFTAAMLFAVAGARVSLWRALSPRDASFMWHTDCDMVVIKQGLDKAPRPADTLSWWTGTWVGQVPFWRPLTSYLFWAQWKLFGWYNQDAWQLVQVISHVLACAAAFVFMEALTGKPAMGVLASALFNVGLRPYWFLQLTECPAVWAMGEWKDSPDQWVAGCVLLAALFAWRGRLWHALVAAAFAAMFKETGFIAFPLLMGLYWVRWRRLPREFAAVIALAAVMAAIKLQAVGIGYVLGSNHALAYRLWRFAAGYPLNLLTGWGAPFGVIGVGMAVAVIIRRRPYAAWGALSASVLLGAFVHYGLCRWGIGYPVDPVTALVALLESPYRLVCDSLRSALWLVLAYAGLSGPYRSRVLAMAGAHLLLGLPPHVAPQVLLHACYPASFFAVAATTMCLWSFPGWWASRRAEVGVEGEGPPGHECCADG